MSPERLYLDPENPKNENEIRHISRYVFASNFISSDDSILDCACGSGYGSYILSKKSAQVTGCDVSEKSIEYANSNYKKINFLVRNINSMHYLELEKYDSFICMETIEHISFAECIAWLNKIAIAIKSSGVFIASSPMLRYKDGKAYITNPWHVNEMPREILLYVINSIFKDFEIKLFHQKEDKFTSLEDEDEGFCIMVIRKNK